MQLLHHCHTSLWPFPALCSCAADCCCQTVAAECHLLRLHSSHAASASLAVVAPQEFKLAWLAGNVKEQLETLSRATALPAFAAQHFDMAAGWARATPPGGGQPCTDVIKVVLEGRLQRLTAHTPMDCAAVAEVGRRGSAHWQLHSPARLHRLAAAPVDRTLPILPYCPPAFDRRCGPSLS